jgi:hypothetical protein
MNLQKVFPAEGTDEGRHGTEQAAMLRLKQFQNSADHHHELIVLTGALTALKILAETTWAE